MNIVMLSEVYLPYINGAITHIELLRKQLSEMGHNVYVVTVSDVKRVTRDDYIIRCPGRQFKSIYNYKLGNPFSRVRNQAIAALKPDVLHIHNEYSLGFSAVHLAKSLGVPLVYTLHSDYNKYLFYISKPFFEKTLQRFSVKYINYLAARADVIVSPSPKAQDYLNEQRLDKKVHVLPNAVSTEAFDEVLADPAVRQRERAALDLPEDCLAVCFVGRLGREKSVAELIDVFVGAGFKSEEARLYLIGDGPEKNHLQAQIGALQATDRVYLLGSVANTEIAAKLTAMDCFATASVSEMHSISFLEATAAGLPGLIKLDPPNEWQVDEGENGWIWRTPAEFSSRLGSLVKATAAERDAHKARARAHAAAHAVDKQAEALLEIYEKAARVRAASLAREESSD